MVLGDIFRCALTYVVVLKTSFRRLTFSRFTIFFLLVVIEKRHDSGF